MMHDPISMIDKWHQHSKCEHTCSHGACLCFQCPPIFINPGKTLYVLYASVSLFWLRDLFTIICWQRLGRAPPQPAPRCASNKTSQTNASQSQARHTGTQCLSPNTSWQFLPWSSSDVQKSLIWSSEKMPIRRVFQFGTVFVSVSVSLNVTFQASLSNLLLLTWIRCDTTLLFLLTLTSSNIVSSIL